MPQTDTGLLELAERVEKAEGPDRELDALIRATVFGPPGMTLRQSPINGAWCAYETSEHGRERLWEGRGLSQLQRLGEFTASLDAALTLADDDTAAQAMREAFSYIQAVGWRESDFKGALARATVANILRTRSASK